MKFLLALFIYLNIILNFQNPIEMNGKIRVEFFKLGTKGPQKVYPGR